MAESRSKALLVILDGYGLTDPVPEGETEPSAIHRADTPVIDHLFDTLPRARLSASGTDVGLPASQFGNSEVGHMNLGAGRIVEQVLTRIDRHIEEGRFRSNEVLSEAMEKAEQKGRLHVMGLFSDGGVHSQNRHLYALLDMAGSYDIPDVWVHAFTDGRDTAPRSGVEYVREFRKYRNSGGTGALASIVGRYYAMDRDNRWERTRKAWNLLVRGEGEPYTDPEQALERSYEADVTDEFVTPQVLADTPRSRIRPGDVVVFYNFRGDRARQITRAFTVPGFDEFPTEPIDPHYVTFTRYDKTFDRVKVAFPPTGLPNTLGEVISRNHLKQLRIAETEKYPHVTYFFNGGREIPWEGEERILIPSPPVATYDLQPEMSAVEVADALCSQLMTEKHALCILNFANPDMVGHTGDMEATIRAVETVDAQLGKVVQTAREHGYKMLIIADHGNADRLLNPDGSPHTAHTTAPVPVLLLGESAVQLRNGILADVAPTLLKMMGLSQPEEMTGRPLW